MSDLEAIASALFSADHRWRAEGGGEYVESHAFHALRLKAVNISGTASKAPLRASEYDLSKHVTRPDELGPYERHILATALRGRGVVLLVGTAGCGKSSSLNRVVSHFNDHAIPHHEPGDASGALSLERPIALSADLNQFAEDIRASYEAAENDSDRNAVVESALNRLSNQLLSKVLESLRDPTGRRTAPGSFVDLVRLAYRLAIREIDASGDETFELSHQLLSVIRPEDVEPSQNENAMQAFTRIREALDREGVSARMRLGFWLAILEASRLLDGTPTPPFLAIDNIDPMPEDVQHAVVGALRDQAGSCGFRILISARLSTYRDSFFRGQNDWFPHSGPSPLEVLTTRLLRFLTDPGRYASFREDLSPAGQREALARAFHLFLRLHSNPKDQPLGRILAAVSGDSVRRILIASKELFRAVQNPPDDICRRIERGLQDFRRAYARRLVVTQIGDSIENAIVAAAEEAREDAADDADPRLALDAWIRCVWGAVHGVLDKVSRDMGEGVWDGRADDWSWAFASTPVESLRSSLERSDEVMRSIGGPTIGKLFDEMVPYMAEWDRQSDASGFLTRLVEVGSSLDAGGEQTPGMVAAEERAGALDGLSEDVLKRHKPYEIARRLVETSSVVVRLFEDSYLEGSLTSAKARILQLASQRRYARIPLRETVDRLRESGFSELRVTRFLNELTDSEARLVWINKDFQFGSWKAIEEAANQVDTVVTLTRAGWYHLRFLYPEATYVMAQVGGRAPNLRQTLRATLDGLIGIATADHQDHERRSGEHDPQLEEYSTAFNVAVASAARIGAIAVAHAKQVREDPPSGRRSGKLDEVRDLLGAWARFIEDEASWLGETFSISEQLSFPAPRDHVGPLSIPPNHQLRYLPTLSPEDAVRRLRAMALDAALSPS